MKKAMLSKVQTSLLVIPMAMGLAACEKSDRTFSLLDAASSFDQSATYEPRKVDILWVIDNSGSMQTSQSNLTANFNSFINRFQEKESDFHMAVTGTDAWRAAYQANTQYKDILLKMRQGPLANISGTWGYSPNSGVGVMDKLTGALTTVFTTNATQGINGSGDERAFSSMMDVLNYSGNNGFRRSDAILSVIILSDEDDFSANTSAFVAGQFEDENDSHPVVLPANATSTSLYQLYQDSRLFSVASYKSALDTYAGAGNYAVNAIAVKDTDCRYELNHPAGQPAAMGKRIGRRYIELANMTGGSTFSLCDDFGTSLDLISESLIKLTSVFKLNREPVVSTIQVFVNGTAVPNDPVNGWTYNATTWSVSFADAVVPSVGDNIQIFFTPVIAGN